MSCKILRCTNVPALRALVTAREKDDQASLNRGEVHTITRTIIDPEFRHPVAYRHNIARMPAGESLNSDLDACARSHIAKTIDPLCEVVGSVNLYQRYSVAVGLQQVNR